MKKKFTLSVLLSLAWCIGVPQHVQRIDSLKRGLETIQDDTVKLFHLILLGESFEELQPDSSYYYSKDALTLARKLKLPLNEAIALIGMAYALKNMGNYPASLQTYLSAKEIVENANVEETVRPDKTSKLIKQSRLKGFIKIPLTSRMIRLQILGLTELGLSLLYETTNDYDKGLFHGLRAKQHFEEAANVFDLCLINMILGRMYLSLNKEDSALIFERKAYDLSNQWNYKDNLPGISINLGRIYLKMGNRQLASEYFRTAVIKSREQGYLRGVVAGNLMLYETYQKEGKNDSSIYYANKALGVAKYLNSPDLLLRSYTALAAYYNSSNNNDSTVKYQSLMIILKDSLFNSKQAQQFQAIDFDEMQRRKEIEAAEKAYLDRLQIYLMLTGLTMLLAVAIILWQSNRHKQKAYLLLQNQKQETDFQKVKVEQTLEELKSTQNQLIQSEKMASLGELTAGIAHEIQNPLNFVNNFSEVNEELLLELSEELSNGKTDDAIALANNAIENQKKIYYHGKRADAIVKGMLQHSRTSSGTKEPTDINALCDEYLRLSYHGLRAKDKTFNAKFETDFDSTLEKINVIPQDIGRVILNLINNAFYAVTEKRKKFTHENYEPTVTVGTKKSNGKIQISIGDNGNGIPDLVKDKIFQPFFTTKPTGEGTGLGLSLSYDIVTKGHGGELKVLSVEGSGTELIIILPIAKDKL